ncbi:hypothetical protein QPL66_24910, partial [Escherichia coli]|nr:hypothetical protein [Escherichia coli]
VVYTHFGEGNYEKTESNIRYLLGLNYEGEKTKEVSSFNRNQTPETYLGFLRAKNFLNPKELSKENNIFSFPKSFSDNSWALSGKW